MEKPVVGIIGLGIMGKPMAINLIKAGYHVCVYNRNPKPIGELVRIGAEEASTAKELAERSGIILTILPDGPDV